MQEKSKVPSKKLSSGYTIPMVGLGTYLFRDEENLKDVLKSAILEHGYRHIDTAAQYENEKYIGDALKECFAQGIKREDLFVTTKLWVDDKGTVEDALKASLQRLQLDYVDLYLIHWMSPAIDKQTNELKKTPTHLTWKQMEECVGKGLCRSIGVSNCGMQLLLDILTYCTIKPAVNQIELHPYNVQEEVVSFLKTLGIAAEAYAPLCSSGKSNKPGEIQDLDALDEPVIKDLANKYNKSPGQIILNWHVVSRDHIVIPKTSKKERLSENIDFLDFKMSPEEYQSITDLDKGARFFNPLYDKTFNFIPYWE